MAEEAVHAAFSSSDDRPCNKKVKAPNPGPGTYIDINNPAHCSLSTQVQNWNKEERSQQEEQGIKLGPFGSNTNRFFKSWMNPKMGPDPGAYMGNMIVVQKVDKRKHDLVLEGKSQASTRALTAAEKERTKQNSVFLSQTDRFKVYDKLVGISQSHRTSRVKDSQVKSEMASFNKNNTQEVLKSTQEFSTAADKIQYDFKDTRTQWTSKGRATDYEVFSGKNIGFDKTSPRFNYN